MSEQQAGAWLQVYDHCANLGVLAARVDGEGMTGPERVTVGITEMAEELAAEKTASTELFADNQRQKELIAIYERDRTRHLRLIEAVDKDLDGLGEMLGEEVARLKGQLSLEVAETHAAEAQRDALLEAAPEALYALEDLGAPVGIVKPFRAAIAKATA